MLPSVIILIAWIGFGASHILLSGSGMRKKITSKISPRGFTILFTTITIITMTNLIIVVVMYGGEGQAGFDTANPPVLRWTLVAVSGLGTILIMAGLINYPKSPMALLAVRMRKQASHKNAPLTPPSAIEQVTRHPFFVGLGILASTHVFLADTLATATFFLGLATLSFIGIPLQDRKLQKRWPTEYGGYLSQTSAVPFAVTQKKGIAGQNKIFWKSWTLSVLLAAGFIGLLHPIWSYANGAIFALFILLFGTVGVAIGLLKGKKR